MSACRNDHCDRRPEFRCRMHALSCRLVLRSESFRRRPLTVSSWQRAAAAEPDQRSQLHTLCRRSAPAPRGAHLRRQHRNGRELDGRLKCISLCSFAVVAPMLTWLHRKICDLNRHDQLLRVRCGQICSCSRSQRLQRLCCGPLSRCFGADGLSTLQRR